MHHTATVALAAPNERRVQVPGAAHLAVAWVHLREHFARGVGSGRQAAPVAIPARTGA
jgi:hypothetical protein